jgi:hypothetical protein
MSSTLGSYVSSGPYMNRKRCSRLNSIELVGGWDFNASFDRCDSSWIPVTETPRSGQVRSPAARSE